MTPESSRADRSALTAASHWIEARVPGALRFEHIDRRVVIVSLYAALNVGLALYFIPEFARHAGVNDFALWLNVPGALAAGDLYGGDATLPFVWSPVAAWLLVGVVQLGFWGWGILHVLAVIVLRDWRLIGITLLSWPFWHDTAQGNAFAFVFISGAAALRGSRSAALVYLALLLLMPRPIQLPLAMWLLWKAPELRWPFAALFVAHAAAVLWSGYAPDWIAAMATYGINGPAQAHTDGPPALLGAAWLLIGIPLGIWLTTRGRVGWAGLAVSPYWLMPYYLMLLLDLRIFREQDPSLAPTGRPAGHAAQTRPLGHTSDATHAATVLIAAPPRAEHERTNHDRN